MMQKLALTLCLSLTAAAPWPFSMWREGVQEETLPESGKLPAFYHSTGQMAEKVINLQANCDGLSVETMEDGDRKIQVARYKAPGAASKFKTMVVGGEHARELIGTEIALNFVVSLCGHQNDAVIEEAKKDTEFLVVINANPVSRAHVEQGDFCKRVNPDQVDINRNFAANWEHANEKTTAETHPGKHAFDQPEARILKQLMETFKPHAYLDLHSGFRGMFFPNDVANDKVFATKLQRLVAPVDEAACKCPLGVANAELGYHTSGSALDYSFSQLKVPFSMAVEVYMEEPQEEADLEARWNTQRIDLLKPLQTGSSFMENGISANTMIPMSLIQSGDSALKGMEEAHECLKFFNPTRKESFDKTVSQWTDAVAQLSIKSREIPANAAHEVFAKHPQSFHQKTQGQFQEQPMPQQNSPVWFALKSLGLLLVIYIAIKYYKVKQSKSAEAAPITAQMSPVQVSD